MNPMSRRMFMWTRPRNLQSFGLILWDLVKSFGYNSKELNEIIQLIEANAEYLLEQWYEYFKSR